MSGKWIRIQWSDGRVVALNLDRLIRIVFVQDPDPLIKLEDDPDDPLYLFYQDLLAIEDIHPLTDDPVAIWVVERIRDHIRLAREYEASLE